MSDWSRQTHTHTDLHAQFRGGRVPKHTHTLTKKHTNHGTQHTRWRVQRENKQDISPLKYHSNHAAALSLSHCSRSFNAMCVADDSSGRIGKEPSGSTAKVLEGREAVSHSVKLKSDSGKCAGKV